MFIIQYLQVTDVFKQKLNKVGIMLNKQSLCNYDMNEVIYYVCIILNFNYIASSLAKGYDPLYSSSPLSLLVGFS